MGLMDFVKEAGEKLFGHGAANVAMTEAKADPGNDAKVQAANAAAGDAILTYIKTQNLDATGLTVAFDGTTSTASVFGVAPDQATKKNCALLRQCRRSSEGQQHDAGRSKFTRVHVLHRRVW